jgi:hypothetical protein
MPLANPSLYDLDCWNGTVLDVAHGMIAICALIHVCPYFAAPSK